MSFRHFFSLLDELESYYDTFHKTSEKSESYKNGRVHGEVKYRDGRPSEYFIEGRLVTKEAWEQYIQEEIDNRVHIIHIDGKPYKTTGKKLKEIKKYLD